VIVKVTTRRRRWKPRRGGPRSRRWTATVHCRG